MVKDSGSILFYRLLTLFGTFFNSMITSRMLGPDQKGLLTVIFLIPLFINRFATLGLGQSIIYFGKKEKDELHNIFNNIVTISITLAVILTGLIWFFQQPIMHLFKVDTLTNFQFWAPIISVFPVVFTFFFLHFFLVDDKIFKYNIINTITIWISVAGSATLFFLNKVSITNLIIISSGSNVFTLLLACYFLSDYRKTFRLGYSFSLIKRLFVYGMKSYFVTIFSFLNFKIVIFITAIMLKKDEIAFYFLATSLAEILWQVPNSISTVLFPRVSGTKNIQDSIAITNASIRNSLFIVFIGSLLSLFIIDPAVRVIYGENFLRVAWVFKMLLFGIFIMSIARILFSFFAGIGKPEYTVYLSLITVIINGVIGYFLIQKYRLVGAAITTNLSYLIISVLSLIIYFYSSKSKLLDSLLINRNDFIKYHSIALKMINRIHYNRKR